MPNMKIEQLGKYHVIKEIGQGRFSTVYLAEHPFLKKIVAVKFFRPDLFNNSDSNQSFIREIRTTATLKHENINQVLDLLEDHEHLLMIQEYQPGDSLRKKINTKGRLSFHQVSKIITEIASALDYIHGKGFIHGDVKPENVLFTDDGIAKLTDIGLLQAVKSSGIDVENHDKSQITTKYVSPEQADGKQPTFLSDQYSLGIIAYELYTGEVPFTDGTSLDILLRHVRETPNTASKINPLITPQLDDVINQVLAKDPQKRFPDCSAFARAITAAEITNEVDQYRNLIERATAALSANEPEKAHPLIEFAIQLMPDDPQEFAIIEDLKANEEAQRRYINAMDALDTAKTSAQAFINEVNLSSDPDGIISNLLVKPEPTWLSHINRWKFALLTVLIFGSVGLVAAIVGFSYTNFMPTNTDTKATLVAIARTPTPIPPSQTPTATFTPTPTFTLAPTSTPTSTPTSSPVPTMGLGSTSLRIKDGMHQVYIPAGPFTMGNDRKNDEKPVQTITLDAFWMDQVEVTNAMYALCIQAGDCAPQVSNASSSRSHYFTDPSYANFPVIHVTWNQANTYCGWVNSRLPTEAEWEKAARSTDGRSYPWGEIIDKSLANYDRSAGDTSAGGTYKNGASLFGIYDLSGNVSEWVSSLYKPYPYNATDGREDLNAIGARVLRGGAWSDKDTDLLSSSRSKLLPSNQSDHFGFRCATSP